MLPGRARVRGVQTTNEVGTMGGHGESDARDEGARQRRKSEARHSGFSHRGDGYASARFWIAPCDATFDATSDATHSATRDAAGRAAAGQGRTMQRAG